MNAPVPAQNGFTPGGKIDTDKSADPAPVDVQRSHAYAQLEALTQSPLTPTSVQPDQQAW